MPPSWWQPLHFFETMGATSRFQVTPSSSGTLGVLLSEPQPAARRAAETALPITSRWRIRFPTLCLPKSIHGGSLRQTPPSRKTTKLSEVAADGLRSLSLDTGSEIRADIRGLD